jgi:hypothetical protein
MKMFGDWTAGNIKSGRWVYPNGIYFEGSFKNNKPIGEGTWNFKNGNKLEGAYSQKVKEAGEDDEPEEVEEGAEVKAKFDLVWQANTCIAESAHKVNSVEQ